MSEQAMIDPITGKPVDGGGTDDKTITIKEEDFNDLKRRLDVFEQRTLAADEKEKIARRQAAYQAPPGPSLDDQVSEIDKKIDELDAVIDKAVEDGKPFSKALKARDELVGQKTRLRIKHEDIDPVFSLGAATIDQLSDAVTRSKMKHIDVVKDDYEDRLASLPAEQRMNPKVREEVYNLAVGHNLDKILEAQKEEILRSVSEAQNLEPGTHGGRSSGGAGDGDKTRPEDVLSKENMAAFKFMGKTPDEFYRGLGYEGWDDYYEKTGKEYFE